MEGAPARGVRCAPGVRVCVAPVRVPPPAPLPMGLRLGSWGHVLHSLQPMHPILQVAQCAGGILICNRFLHSVDPECHQHAPSRLQKPQRCRGVGNRRNFEWEILAQQKSAKSSHAIPRSEKHFLGVSSRAVAMPMPMVAARFALQGHSIQEIPANTQKPQRNNSHQPKAHRKQQPTITVSACS